MGRYFLYRYLYHFSKCYQSEGKEFKKVLRLKERGDVYEVSPIRESFEIGRKDGKCVKIVSGYCLLRKKTEEPITIRIFMRNLMEISKRSQALYLDGTSRVWANLIVRSQCQYVQINRAYDVHCYMDGGGESWRPTLIFKPESVKESIFKRVVRREIPCIKKYHKIRLK